MRYPHCLFLVALVLLIAPSLPVYAQKADSFLPAVTTQSVTTDPDDPAIWRHPKDASKSLIFGTNKAKAKDGGALYIFGMDGKVKQVMGNLDRPNNVDVEYGFRFKNGQTADIAVLTERGRRKLHLYYIRRDGSGLKEAGNGIPVFEGETKESFGAPMGIGLYKRPKDGAIFAFVSRKSGPEKGYLWQYQLEDNGHGGVTGRKVRALGNFSGEGEIEAVAVDDELGYVYYADENFGIHKWYADLDQSGSDKELAVFARSGYTGDREGIAIYSTGPGKGYIVCTDQIEKNSVIYVYKREGETGQPHDHSRIIKTVKKTHVDDTDGIEIFSGSLGDTYPEGILVMMNSSAKNFLIFDWRTVMQ